MIAQAGVNGHGNHGTHGPQPNPQTLFSPSDLGWGGRATSSLQSLAPKFPEEPFFFRFLRVFFRWPVPFPFHGQ